VFFGCGETRPTAEIWGSVTMPDLTSTNKVVAQFVARGGDAVRVGHGSVWLCSFKLKELWRVDPNF
jgi:hypothetical protein